MKKLFLLFALICCGAGLFAQNIVNVSGTLIDPNGSPVPNAPIFLYSDCGSDSLDTYNSLVFTNPNGSFNDSFVPCALGSGTLWVSWVCGNTNYTDTLFFQPGLTDLFVDLLCDSDPIDPPQDTLCFADFSYNIQGDTVQFSGFASGGTPPFTQLWDFGDGSIGSGTNPVYTYGLPGIYLVTLTVIDAQGITCSYTDAVTILDPDPTCNDTEVILLLNTDNYPAETDWTIEDANGNVVAGGGNYSIANSSYTELLCLSDGCYSFNITDSYGDGICCQFGQGSYQLLDPNGSVLAAGGDFDFEESTGFGINVSGDSCVIAPPPTCFLGATAIEIGEGEYTFLADVSGTVNPNDYTFQWSASDGASGTGQGWDHSFNDPGNYQVCVTALANSPQLPDCGAYCFPVQVLDDTPDPCTTGNTVNISILLDNYPGESSWAIVDTAGNPLVAGGPYGGFSSGELVTDQVCLPDGCFTFIMYDSFGDGICCGFGQGSYTVTDSLGLLLASGGDFDYAESTAISFNVAGPCEAYEDPIDTCLDYSLIDFSANCPGDAPVCGCDGMTYTNACIAEFCFGVSEWTDGPCGDNGNNGGGGVPTDTTCTLSIGFQYFGSPLGSGDFGFAFFATADSGAAPYQFVWDFGNNSVGSGAAVATTYSPSDSLGVYTVCLTVYDANQCSAWVCETIVIDTTPGALIAGGIVEGSGFAPGVFQGQGPGDPLADVTVNLVDPLGNVVDQTLTDANGFYSFGNLLFGDYYIQVDIPGVPHEPYHLKLTPLQQSVPDLNWVVTGGGVTTSIENVTFAESIDVFPNPTTSWTQIRMDLAKASDLNIVITDVMGRRLYQSNVTLPAGLSTESVNLSGYAPGVYLLSVQSGNEVFTEKLVRIE